MNELEEPSGPRWMCRRWAPAGIGCVGKTLDYGARQAIHLPIALFLAAALVSPSPTFAHHSFAAYESVKTLTLTGTVENFEWTNPHITLQILVRTGRFGEQEKWDIETSAPGILKWFGWNRNSIRRGNRVLVLLNPMRDGSHKGRLHTIKLLDTGQVLQTKLSDVGEKL